MISRTQTYSFKMFEQTEYGDEVKPAIMLSFIIHLIIIFKKLVARGFAVVNNHNVWTVRFERSQER